MRGLRGLGRLARPGALRGFGQEVHPAQDRVRRAHAEAVEHSGETDVPHRRRHPGETRLDGPVADHGPGDMGPVASFVDPQIRGLVGRRGKEGEPGEVGAADALPVRRDVQVIDVEPRVHDGDGDGSAAHAGEDSRSAAVGSQGVRAHGGDRRVVSGPDDADRLDGQHVVRGRDGLHLAVGQVGRVGPQIRIETAHHRAQGLEFPPPPAVGIVRHQGDEDGQLIMRGNFRQFAGERLRKLPLRRNGSQTVDCRQGRDLVQQRRVARQFGADEVAR